MKPLLDPENWLPLKEVAHILRLSRHTIMRLCEGTDPGTRRPYLTSWRPSPGTVLISRESVEHYCEATRRDPEFWFKRKPVQRRARRLPQPSTPYRKRSSSGCVKDGNGGDGRKK